MPQNERLVFRCPCCGQISPADRLESDGPYPLEMFIQRWGGKRKLTDEERLARHGLPFRRGSAPGVIDYEPIEVSGELRLLFSKRLSQLE